LEQAYEKDIINEWPVNEWKLHMSSGTRESVLKTQQNVILHSLEWLE
jgi:hypothetical protein